MRGLPRCPLLLRDRVAQSTKEVLPFAAKLRANRSSSPSNAAVARSYHSSILHLTAARSPPSSSRSAANWRTGSSIQERGSGESWRRTRLASISLVSESSATTSSRPAVWATASSRAGPANSDREANTAWSSGSSSRDSTAAWRGSWPDVRPGCHASRRADRAVRSSWLCRCSSEVNACGCSCASRVEPSMSVNTKATVPVGRPVPGMALVVSRMAAATNAPGAP
jgi:hypothetical protein